MDIFEAQVKDSLVVSRKRVNDVDASVMMFLKLQPRVKLSSTIISDISKAIASCLSPRHVPTLFAPVEDIPYTANGNKVEGLVKAMVCGKKAIASATVINPECLPEYKKFVDFEAGGQIWGGVKGPAKI